MSLEQAMTDLAAAIREQTEVIKSIRADGTAPATPAEPKPAATKKAAPAKADETPAKPAKAAAPAEDEVPYEKVQKAVVALADAKGKPAVKAILADFDVDHAKNLDPARRGELLEKLEAALNAEDDDLA